MNLDFQQILKRTGWLMGEISSIKSRMVAISAMKLTVNGEIGLNYIATICERKISANFCRWIPKNPVKLNPTKSNLIQPNPTKSNQKIAWTGLGGFKIAMEACNP
jgi:hypothetical protein